MINIDRSFYGIHTMEEIYKMFEENENVLQINILNLVESSLIGPKYDMIAHFSGLYPTCNHTFPLKEIPNVNKYLCDRSFKDTDKFEIFGINVFKNSFEDCFDIQIFVKTVCSEVETAPIDYAMEVSKDDYISIDEIRQKYCWRDDVECIMLHNAATNGGTMALLLNESNAVVSENRNYNDGIVKFLKEKKEYILADMKNKKYEAVIQFTPLNMKQTKFNVHIYGYFTDMEGLYKLKNESKKRND